MDGTVRSQRAFGPNAHPAEWARTPIKVTKRTISLEGISYVRGVCFTLSTGAASHVAGLDGGRACVRQIDISTSRHLASRISHLDIWTFRHLDIYCTQAWLVIDTADQGPSSQAGAPPH